MKGGAACRIRAQRVKGRQGACGTDWRMRYKTGRVRHRADLENTPVAQQILRLNTPEVLPAVYTGAQYVDGVQNHRAAQQEVTA